MAERRIGVTGSRFAIEFHRTRIRQAIEDAMPMDVLIHGGANGVDRMAAEIAKELGIRCEEFSADWGLGRAAGPVRNQKMVDSGAICWLAFPLSGAQNAGTWDCVRRAVDADIHVMVTPLAPLKIARALKGE